MSYVEQPSSVCPCFACLYVHVQSLHVCGNDHYTKIHKTLASGLKWSMLVTVCVLSHIIFMPVVSTKKESCRNG